MGNDVRISSQGLRVLRAFLGGDGSRLCGADIMKTTGLSSGTLYPILLRFEEAGLLLSEWEDVNPAQAGRPRKRLYRLLGAGERVAKRELAPFQIGGNAPALGFAS